MVERLASAIVASQNGDGGWGALTDRPSNTEATALGIAALAPSGAFGLSPTVADSNAGAALERGVRWLVAHQHSTGSWPATDQVPGPSWMSSVAVLGLALTGSAPAQARRGGEWLLTQEGLRFDWRTRFQTWLNRLRGGTEVVEVDAQLKGWPWVSDTFSWVEPTSLAMLALRALAADPTLGPSSERAYRLRQGELMIADRMVPTGGWNHGNSRVLDVELEAYPDTTAWALLALRGARSHPAIVESGFAALNRLLAENASPLARALAVLALRAYERDDPALRAQLTAQCAGASVPADARTRALCVLALGRSTFPYPKATHA